MTGEDGKEGAGPEQLTRDVSLSANDRSALGSARSRIETWCRVHPQLTQGVAEMALGATLLAWGAQSGVITLGVDLVGSAGDLVNIGGLAGASTGVAIALVAAKVVGSIGVAAMGSAICVPAALLASGGSVLLGALGYTVGDVSYGLLSSIDPRELLAGASALSVGLFLLVDGARRVARDQLVKSAAAEIRGEVIRLYEVTADVIIRSLPELKAFSASEAAIVCIPTGIAGVGSIAAGSAYAASTVTVLGSKTVGAVALSLGIVSAPAWPAMVAGIAGAGVTAFLGLQLIKWRRGLRG